MKGFKNKIKIYNIDITMLSAERKNKVKTKQMRLDPLIIFSIEWNSYELILRGKQLKYRGQKIGKITKKMRLEALIIFSIE